MSSERNRATAPRTLFASFVGLSLAIASYSATRAAESGSSFYLPGQYGDIAVAVPLPPGTYLLSTSIYYTARAANPLLPNQADQSLEADVLAELIRAYWVPDAKILGARLLMGVRMSALDVAVTADVAAPGGTARLDGHATGVGDLGVVPLSLYWQSGNFYANLYEAINVPTGAYDKTRLANTALHRWAFDTVLGLTWLDPGTGVEISATPGIIYNAENQDTGYRTGIEFHMDAMLNLHLSPTLAVGLHGSVYRQLTADEGAHPSLGSFAGRSYSVGPSLTWHETSGELGYSLSVKWLRELGAANTTEGDLTVLTAGVKF